VIVVVGDNLPPATGARLTALVEGATPADHFFLRLEADDELPGEACLGGRVIAFGHSRVSEAVIGNAALAALGPEGYVLASGSVTADTARYDVVAADGVAAAPDHHVPSPGGAAFGSYALLEELGFAFLHPLAPTVPTALPTTLPTLNIATSPRWPRRNIHLHTMHPLELTELLNGWGHGDPDDLAGWNEMRPEWSTYLEWLVANGQNEVEWILLEAESWAAFATSAERQRRLTLLVDDCHAWGVACGIDVPIALQQQHTWRLVRQEGTEAEEFAQIHERLDYLMACGFDFLSTENGSTEFTNPGAERMLAWIDETARYLDEVHDREALIKVHISVGQTAEPFVDRDTGAPLNFNFLPTYADARMGVMPHTVQDQRFHGQPRRFISALQFVQLIDGHLPVLVAMQQQGRWVILADVKHRAGLSRKVWRFIGRITQQLAQRRLAHAQTKRCGLRQDSGEIAGTEPTDNRLHLG
jgi:hypothetical protein